MVNSLFETVLVNISVAKPTDVRVLHIVFLISVSLFAALNKDETNRFAHSSLI